MSDEALVSERIDQLLAEHAAGDNPEFLGAMYDLGLANVSFPVGFGHGLHHCLGANLARLELRVMFEAILERCAAITLAGPVEWTRSNKHTGIRHLPVTVSAT